MSSSSSSAAAVEHANTGGGFGGRNGKSFGIHNFKGGVAKTTVAMHLAGAFAAHGNKRTCIMDFDPQANLTDRLAATEWLFQDTAAREEREQSESERAQEVACEEGPPVQSDAVIPTDEAPDYRTFVDLEQKNDDNTLMAIFRPVFEDTDRHGAERKLQDALDRVEQGNNHTFIVPVNTEGALFEGGVSPLRGNLFLLRGSDCLREIERAMNSSLLQAKSDVRPACHVGMCQSILGMLKRHFDIIVVDTSPADSALNQTMLMACDFILPPVFPDTGSTSSVLGLYSKVLPKWFDDTLKIVNFQKTCPRKKPFFLNDEYPRILPFLVTNYPRGKEGEVCALSSDFIAAIDGFMHDFNNDPRKTLAQADIETNSGTRLLRNSMCTHQCKMTIAFLPEMPMVIRACAVLGRTIHEMSWQMYSAEYLSSAPTAESAEGQQITRNIELMQTRYNSLVVWLCNLAHIPGPGSPVLAANAEHASGAKKKTKRKKKKINRNRAKKRKMQEYSDTPRKIQNV